MGRVVLSMPLGGLGDHLLLSTLPRRLTEAGDEVYFHRGPLTVWSNPGIRDLILANPHIRGEVDDPPTAGWGYPSFPIWGQFGAVAVENPLAPFAILEHLHALPPPYSNAPEIYVDLPEEHDPDLVVVDLGSTSQGFDEYKALAPYLSRMTQLYPKKRFVAVKTPAGAAERTPDYVGLEEVEVGDLFAYARLMASAFAVVSIESGQALLASAVKALRPHLRVHVLYSTVCWNMRIYPMTNVCADVTSFASPVDFANDPMTQVYRHLKLARDRERHAADLAAV